MNLPPTARGRLDRAITEALRAQGRDVSVREVRRALQERRILVDGRPRAPGATARGGEHLDLSGFVPRAEAVLVPDRDGLAASTVLFEDETLLVLDKPSGVPTQPLRPEETKTLLHVAVARAPEIAQAGPPLEGGLVHRLDVGTSGVVVFAKTAAAREALRAELDRHAVHKRYLALVEGAVPDEVGVREAIAAAGKPDRVRVVPWGTEGALPARTDVRRLATHPGGFAWVEATTRYGRRHQVRAHLASIEAPIVGDEIYGAGPTAWLGRLGLHAAQVELPDGRTFEAPVPEDLTAARRHLGLGENP